MSLNGKSILVTGGTGSFGQKFAEVILARFEPKKLIIFSRDELKQQLMRQKITDMNNSPVRYFIGDVRDIDRLRRAMDGVDIVVHAAALKQIQACEYNPIEAILTNIMGAKNIIDAALDENVEKVIALSTDKAVNPINLYGATKLCMEKLFIQSNSYAGNKKTGFSCVRYGNVVGSRGSVIPIFMGQRQNGSVTVTDPRMTRFWMTLEEGVEFVIRSIDKMHGGEVFVPKIRSMKVMDLANTVAPECEIRYVGIRSGEKLHEMLISEDETRQTLEIDDMFIIQPSHHWWHSKHWRHGRKLKEDFRYSSDTNSQWLTEEQLDRMVRTLDKAS